MSFAPSAGQPSPSVLAAANDLRTAETIAGFDGGGGLEARALIGRQGMWLLLSWGTARYALRAGYAPDPTMTLEDWAESGDGYRAELRSSLGRFVIDIHPDPERPLMRVKTSLQPELGMKIRYWPRDLFPLGPGNDPLAVNGTVHVQQRGSRGGLLYATSAGGEALLYMQDLTSLNGYCQTTGATLDDTVGGEWPELGFSLPPGEEALAADHEVTIADAYVAFGGPAEAEAALASTFLELLGNVYLKLQRPRTEFRDWWGAAENTLADLASKQCWSEAEGQEYLNAYVGDLENPPESMVQLAVLVPLLEYSQWRGRQAPYVKKLRAGLAAFWDPKTNCLGRWHPAKVDLLKEDEPHKKPRVMDSWYLYHPLLNLSRMALAGDDEAKDLFLRSLPFVIEVAHHFDYRWPVFYDLDTLEVIKAESKPGEGGENDVGGFHAHLMVQAWKITGQQEYLDEARRAADSLVGLGFKLAYQMNITAFAAGALFTLYQETGEGKYRELSEICLANIFTNLFLWECDYGYAAHYPTFMGLFPLAEAPYTAAYEEVEAVGALERLLVDAKGDIPTYLKILLPELIHHLLSRGIYYYPKRLPAEAIVEKPRTGEIIRDLSIPLEDLYDGTRRAGSVGQQVYGAGSPFGLVIRHYTPIRAWNLAMYCDYTIDDFAAVDRAAGFWILGDPRLRCEIRLIDVNGKPAPEATLEPSEGPPDPGEITQEGHRRFQTWAGQRVQIRLDHG